MSSLINLGAINTSSGQYESPIVAKKDENIQYTCPDCEKPVMLRKGIINKPHFAHYKSTNMCNHYNHPGEGKIHKHAKEVFKRAYDAGILITFTQACSTCKDKNEIIMAPKSISNTLVLEYTFDYNGKKKADIALIEGDILILPIEICDTHKTKEHSRPEPWIELDARTCIDTLDKSNLPPTLQLQCIRSKDCSKCIMNKTNNTRYNILNEKSIEWFLRNKADLEWYIRYTLGQRDFTEKPSELSQDQQKYYKYVLQYHDRINFHDADTWNTSLINKFSKFYPNRRILSNSWKGQFIYKIISKYDTTTSCDDIYSNDYPYAMNKGWHDLSGEGTISIIMHILLQFSVLYAFHTNVKTI